jgi:hypothetical protein
MDKKTVLDIIIVCGSVCLEIGGIWVIKKCRKYNFPGYLITLAKFICILGIITLIIGFTSI